MNKDAAIIAIKIEKTDEKLSSKMANILSWIAAVLLGAASPVVLALLVWNGFPYLEYLRQPPLARPFSHGSFAPVGDDDDWTFKPQFAENAAARWQCGHHSGRDFMRGVAAANTLAP